MFDANLLGHTDLNMVDIAPIPQRLQKGVGEAKRQDVLHRLLAQIMVDPVDLGLIEDRGQRLVERAGRGQIVPKWLFDHDPGLRAILRQAGFAQVFGDRIHQRRRSGQVEDMGRRTAPIVILLA